MVTIADHLLHGDHYDLYLMVIHVWQPPPPPPDPNALYAYYLRIRFHIFGSDKKENCFLEFSGSILLHWRIVLTNKPFRILPIPKSVILGILLKRIKWPQMYDVEVSHGWHFHANV